MCVCAQWISCGLMMCTTPPGGMCRSRLSAFPSTGYLGYTSGLSLLCMVFFLIVVSGAYESTSPFLVLPAERCVNASHLLSR